MYTTKQRTRGGQRATGCFWQKTLNPRQKKSAKKKSEFFSSPSHVTNPHRLLYALFERERHIVVLSLILSLLFSLCTYIVRFETLSVCIFVFRSRECALISGAEEERLTHHTYIIYIRVGGEIWIGSTPEKKEFRSVWKGEN